MPASRIDKFQCKKDQMQASQIYKGLTLSTPTIYFFLLSAHFTLFISPVSGSWRWETSSSSNVTWKSLITLMTFFSWFIYLQLSGQDTMSTTIIVFERGQGNRFQLFSKYCNTHVKLTVTPGLQHYLSNRKSIFCCWYLVNSEYLPHLVDCYATA